MVFRPITTAKLIYPSACMECQSAALGDNYMYHTARQSSSVTMQQVSYHPVITNLLFCG